MIPYNSLPSVRGHLLVRFICSEIDSGRQTGFDPDVAVEEVRERYRAYDPKDLDRIARRVDDGLELALEAAVSLIRERASDCRVLEAMRRELEESIGPVKDVAGAVTIAFRLAEARYCKEVMRDEGLI